MNTFEKFVVVGLVAVAYVYYDKEIAAPARVAESIARSEARALRDAERYASRARRDRELERTYGVPIEVVEMAFSAVPDRCHAGNAIQGNTGWNDSCDEDVWRTVSEWKAENDRN